MSTVATETYRVDIPLERIVRVLRDPTVLAAAVATADASARMASVVRSPAGTTIMFGDLEGFTPLAERIGDLAVARVVRELDTLVDAVVDDHGGVRVTSAGDGFMAVFSEAGAALHAAAALQQSLVDAPARMRIGVHTGPVVAIPAPGRAGDVVGRSVIVAARIVDAAAGGEVLVSAATFDGVATAHEFRFDGHRTLALKGLTEHHRVAALRWRHTTGGSR